MLDEIYNARILELAGNIGRVGRLATPDATRRVQSRLCGSTVTVDLTLDGDRVADFAHEVKACALGQASSALMAEVVVGSSAAELRGLRDRMIAMLKADGPPPEGRFAAFECLLPIRAFKARHASTLLTFDAVVGCLDDLGAPR